jgi:asparagine N-glycosylation enzyme membrane subunit Stt3
MALFLFAYKRVYTKNKFDKTAILYSVLAGIGLSFWYQTWSGYWYITAMITGFIFLMLIVNLVKTLVVKKESIKEFFVNSKSILMSFATIFIVFFLLVVPSFGAHIIPTSFLGITAFGGIKAEQPGQQFPNVQVSVQELMTPGDVRDIIQKTSPISFAENPLAMLFSPFFLMLYAIIYLFYSFFRTGKHMDTMILLFIWFVGPFYATMTAVRFSILFSAPMAIGSAILLAKLFNMASKNEKLEV